MEKTWWANEWMTGMNTCRTNYFLILVWVIINTDANTCQPFHCKAYESTELRNRNSEPRRYRITEWETEEDHSNVNTGSNSHSLTFIQSSRGTNSNMFFIPSLSLFCAKREKEAGKWTLVCRWNIILIKLLGLLSRSTLYFPASSAIWTLAKEMLAR